MESQAEIRPFAFISHAGEDRTRFVDGFATRLVENGVDCWASFWDILPGDDLINSIFDQGIGASKNFVIILSNNSVHKPWVREELSAAMVRKIAGTMKIVPVRLDGCTVPESLKHVHWQDIHDASRYESEFRRIVDALFGVVERPKPGRRPAYTNPPVLLVGDLTPLDSLIFDAGCRIALETDGHLINEEPLRNALLGKELHDEQIIESQEVLAGRGYINLFHTMDPPHISPFSITLLGFDRFVNVAVDNWSGLLAEVASRLHRDGGGNHGSIAHELKQPRYLIEHAFRILSTRNLLRFCESKDGGIQLNAYWISPELKRTL